ncbi:XRE family transcriptional regulator [Treponema sp. R8-4-B8]
MKYKSEIYEVVHQDAVEMFKIGAISEDRMKEYDKKCLVQETETSYTADNSPKTEYVAAAK